MKMYDKKVVAQYQKYLDNEEFRVIVTIDNKQSSDGETYYNIHVISEKYRNDELNTLRLQEPKSEIENEQEYFNNAYLISQLMEFFIWDRFYNEGIFKGYVKSEFEAHE